MTRACSILAASLLLACGGAPAQFQVGGRIVHETLEGGFWAIQGDDGVTYDPRNLGPQYAQEGLPVLATLVLHRDMGSAHMVGPIVDVVSIEVVPGFAGAWRGTKTYLTADGHVAASAGGWPFVIRMTGRDELRFVNGPAAKIAGDGTLVISSYTYRFDLPPSSAACSPIIDSVVDGTGTLAPDGTLSVTLNWTHFCNGATSRSITKYSMSWIPALAPSEFSQL